MRFAWKLFAILALSLAASASRAQEKAVYHFDSGLEQATKGLRNINNHLEVDPKARLIAVTPSSSFPRGWSRSRICSKRRATPT